MKKFRSAFLFPAIALYVCIAVAGCSDDTSHSDAEPKGGSADAPKSYTFQGTPLSIDSAKQMVTIDHEAIDGYMEAMTMPFKVADTSLYAKIRIGEKMRFNLEVAYNAARITDVSAIQ
jgi:protein SCO1/2